MKHLLLSLILCGLITLSISAQTNGQDSYVNIQAPAAASRTRGASSCGLRTSSGHFMELKDGAIELPLNLQYNASGIKVAEEASRVGLGWDLPAGGMIVQTAVGKMDEEADYNIPYISDYPQGSFPGYLNLYYRLDDIQRYETYYKKATESRLQPDIFYFSFPGGSGKFFIDYRDGSAHQIDASRPLKIEQLGSSDTWQITTEDGTQHIFGGLPKVWQEDGASARPVSRTFLLTGSIYPNGQVVRYEYERRDNVIFSRSENGEHIIQQCVGLAADLACDIRPTVTSYKTKSDEVLLKSITTNNYIAEFKMSARSDLSSSQKLDTIVIKARSASQWSSRTQLISFNPIT